MKRTLLLCMILGSTVINCSRFDQAQGSGGAGGGGGGAGRGVGGMMTHLELCGIIATCQDGVLGGMYGTYCQPIIGVCPLGCRAAYAATTDQTIDHFTFAQTLCVSPDAGDAGADDAGQDADPPDGVSDAAGDGV